MKLVPPACLALFAVLTVAACTKTPHDPSRSEDSQASTPSSLAPVADLAALEFMIGEWEIEESEFNAQGERTEHIEGGEVVVAPVLRGDWLQMTAEGDVSDALMWLFAHDASTGLINAWAFSSGYAQEVRAVGGLNVDGVFEVRPLGDLGGRMRMAVHRGEPDEVHVRIFVRDGDRWRLRTEEFWRRR